MACCQLDVRKVQCYTLESSFSFDLIMYALEKYDFKRLTLDLLAYRHAIFQSKYEEQVEKLKQGGNKTPTKQQTSRIRKKCFADPPSPFCEHLGDAILAVSHVHMINFKLRFDSIFASAFEEPRVTIEFVKDIYKEGYFSQFLVVYAFMVQWIVYMSLRNKFGAYKIWNAYDSVYKAMLEEKFLQRGGWQELKRAARPWWQSYRKARASGVEFHRPEWVYYNRSLSPSLELFMQYRIVTKEKYTDEGDSEDFKTPMTVPKSMKSEDQVKLACTRNGCCYYCMSKVSHESLVSTIECSDGKSKSSEVSSTAVASAEAIEQVSGAEGISSGEAVYTTGAEGISSGENASEVLGVQSDATAKSSITALAEQVRAVRISAQDSGKVSKDAVHPVPEMTNYFKAYNPPPGFITRKKAIENYQIVFNKVLKVGIVNRAGRLLANIGETNLLLEGVAFK